MKNDIDVLTAATMRCVMMAIGSGCIILADTGPVCLGQIRVGQLGRSFETLKFRALNIGRTDHIKRHLEILPKINHEFLACRKAEHMAET